MPMLENANEYKNPLAAIVSTDTSAMVDLEMLQTGTVAGKQD